MLRITAFGIILLLCPVFVWAGTLTDSFDDHNVDGWTKEVGKNWRFEGGELIMGPGDTAFSIGEASWGDYTVGVRVRIIEQANAAGWTQGPFIRLRALTTADAYHFSIGTFKQSPRQAQGYRTDGEVIMRMESEPFDWKFNTDYELKVVIEGNVLKHYVDDELIIEYTDDTYAAGPVGIGVNFTVVAHFDDFYVTGTGVPNDSLSISPNGKLATQWGTIKRQP